LTFPDVDLAEDGFSASAPVDTYAPNGYGLYTVAGNVWEWCADCFDARWHETGTAVNPVGPPFGAARVMKGGSYLCHASFCFRFRNAARTANTPDSATGNIGFRVVRDV
jgi:sulfatase modifying factor 1